MEKIRNLVDGARIRVRGLYDGPLGSKLPTRQVLAAGLAGVLATLLDEVIPGLEVSDALLAVVASSAVAYLVGPPKVGGPETFQLVPQGHVVGLIPQEDFEQQVVNNDALVADVRGGGSTSLPKVEGVPIGPSDDDTEPGRHGFV